MTTKIVCFLLITIAVILLFAVNVLSGPTLYRIKIDPADLSGVDVEIVAHPEEKSVRIAMAAHPEYDDRYYRYIRSFTARSGERELAFTKPEEAVWQVDGVTGQLTVRYRVTLEPNERQWRQTWKPHLSPTGGMVGDLHMLMYIVGQEKHPALLSLDMPAGWKAVSGIERYRDQRTFLAPVDLLLDSPILVGDVKEWNFTAGGVPHTVAIWSPPDARTVDPKPVVEGIQKLAEQAIKAFGPPPYPRYAFLIENGGQAALEHRTSLNVALSDDLSNVFQSIGHEYVHVWNLMDVRPRERIGLRYKFADPTGVLWWNEGATIMFADLLLRRAGITADIRTRIQRLESLIARYLSAPGYSTLSAEMVSRADSHPELLRDDWAGTHLQGEVLTTMLDLMIRDAIDGRRKLDDVMRTLADRFDLDRGIVNSDTERAISEVCACRADDFFSSYIYNAGRVDFDKYLAFIGMKSEVSWNTASGSDGKPALDLRIMPVSTEGELKLRNTNSNSAWFRAGVRTGDKLISINGEPVTGWNAFRRKLVTLKVGDSISLVVERGGSIKTVDVEMKPYEVPTVLITPAASATQKQLRLREAWINSDAASK